MCNAGMDVEKNSSTWKSPYDWVIEQFGSARKTAKLLGFDPIHGPSKILHWRNYKDEKGRPGQIPRRHHQKILELARKLGLDIKAEDIIEGREIEE